jgi:hypothetical protein
VHDALIRGNTLSAISIGGSIGGQRGAFIIQEGSQYATTRLPRNIRIEKNLFENIAGVALIARGVDDLIIADNTIDGYCMLPSYAASGGRSQPSGMGAAIVLDSVKGLTMTGNQVKNPGEHASGEAIARIETD